MAVPQIAMGTVPTQLKTIVQVAKLDVVRDALNNAVPTAQRVAKPLVQVPVLMDVAHFAVDLVIRLVAAHVLMFPLVQVARQAHVQQLAETTVIGLVRWLVARVACPVA